MGKSRKFSKGLSTGFVPEYRHAVETMAESEGLGSSGRVDTEMTLSEDSCTPRRKCISINGDGYNRFGVPVQVLPLSRMSKTERRDLEFKLRRELEQVRVLQKKVASVNLDAVVMSPSSVCSAGKKRPPVQSIVPDQHPSGKKRVLGGSNGIPEHAVLVKGDILMKQCESLLNQLMRHKSGWVFNNPVDVVKLNLPDYFTIIKNPMDFGTIKGKIAAGEYSSPLGFAADVRLTFSNAMLYNPPQNDVHIMAKGLSKYFESRWKAIEKKIPLDVRLSSSAKDANVRHSVVDHAPPLKKKKLPPVAHAVKSEPVKRKMSDEDKQKLSMELESLLAELPDSVIEFLKENSSGAGQAADDEIEIDILALSDDILLKLRKLLDDYLVEKKKNETRAKPCEIEIHTEGGVKNLPMQRGKGNDAVEEDIDIGGNDSPILSFPPVEIEKDAAHENCKASSSSGSSSGSGSSSSDSDSASSSGSESEGTKVLDHDTIDAEEVSNHKQINTKDPDIRRTENQAEPTPATVPSLVEGGSCPVGESAPSERQVSPEKVYREALLKGRFADTILKAREKTLEKGVKRDPEKLRMEREKLERMQKEEKARLQAAAMAAEEARKKAEAKAAAEARRRREMEREAARLALQKMEKTVDINESSQFLEDLEMLRADPANDSCNLAKDASLEHSENMLGSFNLGSSGNPLEQLGLYMKQDEEEEDGGATADGEAPQSTRCTTNDVEEGEID